MTAKRSIFALALIQSVHSSKVCPLEVGPFSSEKDPSSVDYKYEQDFSVDDSNYYLSDIHHCSHVRDDGTWHKSMRGWTATFNNRATGDQKTFTYGLTEPSLNSVKTVECEDVQMVDNITQYNVREVGGGIGGFIFEDDYGVGSTPCTDLCIEDMAFDGMQTLPGPIIGFRVQGYDKTEGSLNMPGQVWIVTNSCPCPDTEFLGDAPPSDMTAKALGSGIVTQPLPFQGTQAEDQFAGVSCGSYSIELTPAKDFLSVSKSGKTGPNGEPFFDTLSIDQSKVTAADVGTQVITMRVFQATGVDGYSEPQKGTVSGEITYTFQLTVDPPTESTKPDEFCPYELGPFSSEKDPSSVDYKYLQDFQVDDPDYQLASMHYCYHIRVEDGSGHNSMRGWEATFKNFATGDQKIFKYGLTEPSEGSVKQVECKDVQISGDITEFNVREVGGGIGGFIFKDDKGVVTTPCTHDCVEDMAFDGLQTLPGPIIGFRVQGYDKTEGSLNMPGQVWIVANSCPASVPDPAPKPDDSKLSQISDACDFCPYELGPFSSEKDPSSVDYKYLQDFSVDDPDYQLASMHYCYHIRDDGSGHKAMRGWESTFKNYATGDQKTFKYGLTEPSEGSVKTVECEDVQISGDITQFNVREVGGGIGGFVFKDDKGVVTTPCTHDCVEDMAFDDLQTLPGPIIGFRVEGYDKTEGSLNMPGQVWIVTNYCPKADYSSHIFNNWGDESIADNELTVFKDKDFSGRQWTLTFDLDEPDRKYYYQLKGTGFNQEISSWKLGRGLHAEFCESELVFGDIENGAPVFSCPDSPSLGSAVGAAANTAFEPEDKISGVILSQYDPLVRPAATVYSGLDCTGRSAALFSDGVDSLDAVRYDQAELSAYGLADNSVSSFMAPVGTHVHVYEQSLDQGEEWREERFVGQEDKDGWMVCQNLDLDWQDVISSLTVQYALPQPAKGRWLRVGEGEHTHQYFSGFFTKEDSIPKTVQQGNLLAQFEVGLEFQNKHCDVSSALCTEEIRQKTYELMMDAYDAPTIEEGLCEPRHPIDNKIGYYAFIVESQDGNATIISSKGVCKYGENWDVAPLCPPAACLDDNCDECGDWF